MTAVSLHLADCTVTITPGHVRTALPNGGEVLGMPHHTPEYRDQAQQAGYGDDVARLNACHETAHTLLAHWLGLPACPVFERVARGEHRPTTITEAVEAAVMAFEVYCNAMGIDLIAVAQRWAAPRVEAVPVCYALWHPDHGFQLDTVCQNADYCWSEVGCDWPSEIKKWQEAGWLVRGVAALIPHDAPQPPLAPGPHP